MPDLSACPACWCAVVASVVAVTSRAIRAIPTESPSILESRASGRSSQPTQVSSRSSRMKSRKIISRNIPPNAAMAGCASVTNCS